MFSPFAGSSGFQSQRGRGGLLHGGPVPERGPLPGVGAPGAPMPGPMPVMNGAPPQQQRPFSQIGNPGGGRNLSASPFVF